MSRDRGVSVRFTSLFDGRTQRTEGGPTLQRVRSWIAGVGAVLAVAAAGHTVAAAATVWLIAASDDRSPGTPAGGMWEPWTRRGKPG